MLMTMVMVVVMVMLMIHRLRCAIFPLNRDNEAVPTHSSSQNLFSTNIYRFRKREGINLFLNMLKGDTQINERRHHHVTGYSKHAIYVENFHRRTPVIYSYDPPRQRHQIHYQY